jgi:hypothetical protein
LVGLRLASNLLKVHQLTNVGMDEDVVAPARSPLFESERFDEAAHVGEGDIRHVAAREPREKPPQVHRFTLPRLADADLYARISMGCFTRGGVPSLYSR